MQGHCISQTRRLPACPPGGGADSIVVIMLTLNQRDKTVRCLSSLNKVAHPHRTLLWDNGSQDGTLDAVHEQFPQVVTHYCDSNLGVASGRNAAARLAIERLAPSHLLFLDNDMVVSADFIERLYAPFTLGNAALAQTSAKIRFLEDQRLLYSAGGSHVRFWLGATAPAGHGEVDRGQHDQTTTCLAHGGAMMVRSDVFQTLDGFDPAFNPYGPEDLDFALRVRAAGYQGLYVPQAVVFHERSQTFESGRYTPNYARNKAQKWMLFMHRHASWPQRLAFHLIGAPYLLVRALIREGKNRNFAAISGLIAGVRRH
jgi:GT2 family glycosyltransferase